MGFAGRVLDVRVVVLYAFGRLGRPVVSLEPWNKKSLRGVTRNDFGLDMGPISELRFGFSYSEPHWFLRCRTFGILVSFAAGDHVIKDLVDAIGPT